MLHTNNGIKRVAEGPALPYVEAAKAKDALAFHRKMEEAQKSEHKGEGYVLLPMVGTGQPTSQSATTTGEGLTTSYDVPPGFDPLWAGGDGTVPYVSAIPLDMSFEPRLGYVCEQHGSIQNNNRVLDYLGEFLRRTQTRDLSSVRGETGRETAGERPGLSLDLDDFFDAGETVALSVSVVGTNRPAKQVTATMERADENGEATSYRMTPAGDGWLLLVDDLPGGVYRAHIRATATEGPAPTPITGLFEVADE
jgi:hypothetical protein